MNFDNLFNYFNKNLDKIYLIENNVYTSVINGKTIGPCDNITFKIGNLYYRIYLCKDEFTVCVVFPSDVFENIVLDDLDYAKINLKLQELKENLKKFEMNRLDKFTNSDEENID